MKQNKTLIKELRQELHYHQMMVRVDLRAVRAGVRKCKEIGAKMRVLQNGSQPTMRAADLLPCGHSYLSTVLDTKTSETYCGECAVASR